MIYIILASVVLLLVILAFAGGYYMYRFTVVRDDVRQKNFWEIPLEQLDNVTDEWFVLVKEGEAFLKSLPQERVEIVSRDGLRLAGHYFRNEKDRGIFLMVHGYRSNGLSDFSGAARDLFDLGFSLLIIDQRGCGYSEGKFITFGVKERFDLVDWADYIAKRWPGTPVVADGISMGAATVLMACGAGYPENVKALLADCGYTVPGAICRKCLKDWFRLPPFPIYYTGRFWVRLFAKIDLDGISATEALRTFYRDPKAPPILIAHGTGDGFVPCSMSDENMTAFEPGDPRVEYLKVPDAAHGLSYLKDTEAYRAAVARLLEKAGI